ncbi:MAG: hypothetical protein GSR86_07370 [Desulfurococcales archaeon]|nr:hypothetical protein [Desulfurococcales archaeon]
MEGKQALGAVITIIGLLLFLYVIAAGGQANAIGSKEALNTTALAAIIGWFMILIGPALWFGETPAVIKKRAGR